MLKAVPLIVIFAMLALAVTGQIQLPQGAKIIERIAVPAHVRKHREIVLWMIRPKTHERGPLNANKPYSCPDLTLGSYYSGPTRLSLVDAESGTILNTIRLSPSSSDTFEIPYRILPHLYAVPGVNEGVEGKPSLLGLRDLNGDGLALEFAFYQAEACMGLLTTLCGYSPKQDKVVQYPVELKIEDGKTRIQVLTWVDYLFSKAPNRVGLWQYEIDYRGRSGQLEHFRVRYDRQNERFVGTLRFER